MQLEVSDEEAVDLRELLQRVIGDLYVEISHTDNPDYRRGLRARRDRLRRVLEALTTPTQVA